MKVERYVNQMRIEGALPPLFIKNLVIQDKIRKKYVIKSEKNESLRSLP